MVLFPAEFDSLFDKISGNYINYTTETMMSFILPIASF
jgi:hypothetical protein